MERDKDTANSAGRQRRRNRGVGLIITVIVAGVLFGFLALTFDLGRIYIAQNELQTFTDAASLASTPELDGTDEGVIRARSIARSFPNRWTFGTQEVVNPEVYFSQDVEGPWLENPPSPPEDYRFVRVTAQGPVPLYFLQPFLTLSRGGGGGSTSTVGGGSTFAASAGGSFAATTSGSQGTTTSRTVANVRADSDSGQLRKTTFQQGLLPYSPHAHLDMGRDPVINPGYDVQDPFNFEVGRKYTIRWPPPGQRTNDLEGRCEGDIYDPAAGELLFDPPMAASDRGFIDIGEPTFNWAGAGGSAFIREAIVGNTQSHGIVIGEPVKHASGQRSTEDAALRERIDQDLDPYSRTYAEYLATGNGNGAIAGNGRRIVFMPVEDPWDGDRVVEFATFFLPPSDEVCCPAGPGMCGNGQGGGGGGGGGSGSPSPKPCCAEYIGSGILYGIKKPASGEVAVYVPQLTR